MSIKDFTLIYSIIFLGLFYAHTSGFRASDNAGQATKSSYYNVVMLTPPSVFASSYTVCDGDSVTISAICHGGGNVVWSNGEIGSPIDVSAGYYRAKCVEESTESGWSNYIFITDEYVPNEPVVGTNKLKVCGDEKAMLIAHCPIGSVVKWSNGLLGSPIQVGAGIYSAKCKNGCGQSQASQRITIDYGTVPPKPQITASKTTICDFSRAVLTANCPIGTQVIWSNGMFGSLIQVYQGIYSAICVNDCGYSQGSESIVINSGNYPPPKPILVARDYNICENDTTLLIGKCSPDAVVVWSNGQTGNEIEASAGLYEAQCVNECGLSSEQSSIQISNLTSIPAQVILNNAIPSTIKKEEYAKNNITLLPGFETLTQTVFKAEIRICD